MEIIERINMKDNVFCVILTNGIIENEYLIETLDRDKAIILAQAEAIKQSKGYNLVRCTKGKIVLERTSI